MTFPVSGVETPIWVPPGVAFILGTLCASAGVSGAFLLLPFQVSVLGFTSPAVSPTNLIFNVVGIPGAIFRYFREGRLDWHLAGIMICGYLPGLLGGVVVRLFLLPDPRHFKLFIAAVLLFLAGRMWSALRSGNRGPARERPMDLAPGARIISRHLSWRWISASLGQQEYGYRPLVVMPLSGLVGVVAGAYGIGGGALMAPLLLAFFRVPVHAMAGANLLATLVGSVIGLAYYTFLGPLLAGPQVAVRPDWLLGVLFGVGGLGGTYCGARMQRFLPARWIKIWLAVLLVVLAGRYILGALG